MATADMSHSADTSSMREFVRNYAYGTIMIGSMLVLWWAVEGPYPLEYVVIALQITAILTILALEVYIPFQKKWGTVRNVTRADVIYFAIAPGIELLQTFLLITLLAATAQYHQYIRLFDWWPRNLPILLQLFLVTMVVDVLKYWYHRWTHEVPFLWRFHIIHHRLERLEMLRSAYFYPIDLFLTVGLGTLALLACGASKELIIFHNVWAGITGLLNHSNADVRCGWFDTILNSPGHHRAHHSVNLPGVNSNYGSFFNFADRMFGTRYLPDDQSDFGPLGVDETYDVPKTVLAQLAVPFRWKRVHKVPELVPEKAR
jgi:sterol desaturase/sphingolipid hydroxylase (fatty acid hydroxylase superfamily)